MKGEKMARFSIHEQFYNGMSFVEIKRINPFATNDYLKNTAVLSHKRLEAITRSSSFFYVKQDLYSLLPFLGQLSDFTRI